MMTRDKLEHHNDNMKQKQTPKYHEKISRNVEEKETENEPEVMVKKIRKSGRYRREINQY